MKMRLTENEMRNFRSDTLKSTMIGAEYSRFLCKKCMTNKPIKGRKAVVKGSSKFGFHCAECAK